MVRVITVLVSTFVFALLGFLIVPVAVHTDFLKRNDSNTQSMLLVIFCTAPMVGGVIGFITASMTLKMFGPPKS